MTFRAGAKAVKFQILLSNTCLKFSRFYCGELVHLKESTFMESAAALIRICFLSSGDQLWLLCHTCMIMAWKRALYKKLL